MRYLRVFEWSGPLRSREPGMVPVVFVNIFGDDAVAQGERAAAELAGRRPGERALVPLWLLSKQIRRRIPDLPERGELDPLTIFENGIDVRPSIEWLTPLSRALQKRGITLDLIASDVEDGVGTHHMMPAWDREGGAWLREMERIYRSTRAYEKMPDAVKKLRPRDYNPWTPAGKRAIDTFNAYAGSLVTSAIREVFIGSKLFNDRRGRQPFRISNWEDIRPTFPLVDINGWRMPPNAVDTVSSPAAYLNSSGHHFQDRVHDASWCGFVHCLNLVRSCAATPRGSVIPWISSPRYYARRPQRSGEAAEGYDEGNVWLWKELIAHLVRSGCRDFLLWNCDPEPEESHRMVAETMRANDRPYSQRALPELAFDADEVTTRGYTTRYSDYLASRDRLVNGGRD